MSSAFFSPAFVDAVLDARAVARTAGPVPKPVNRMLALLIVNKKKEMIKRRSVYMRTNLGDSFFIS